jgi:uncharacterized protein (DUF924 family)
MNSIPDAVLRFWFGESAGSPETARRQSALWWSKQPAIDTTIRRQFAPLVQAAGFGRFAEWQNTARGTLALIITLDQFPRNLFRGSPRAFAYDAQAREAAIALIRTGEHRQLRLIERVFVYLPLEHSEIPAHQDECVALFEALYDEAPEEEKAVFAGYVDFAHRHRDIVRRFGRFPHRNAALGRASTPEESAFLLQPGSSF